MRRDFPDTAYWQPGVVTDAEGQAVVSITLPDNLTRWRGLARAVSLDTRVGETMTAITVTQDLIVRPSLPRFLIQGDVARLRAIAHNYLSYEVTATTELSASGLVLLGEGCGPTGCQSPPVSLPPGGAITTDWSAVASVLGEGSVLTRLRTDAGGDAVELPLPIHPFAVPARGHQPRRPGGTRDHRDGLPVGHRHTRRHPDGDRVILLHRAGPAGRTGVPHQLSLWLN